MYQKAQKNVINCLITKIIHWCYIYFDRFLFHTYEEKIHCSWKEPHEIQQSAKSCIWEGIIPWKNMGWIWTGWGTALLGRPDEIWAKCEPTLCRSSSDHFLQSADLLIQPESRSRKVTISLYLTFIRPHLEYHMQLWVPQFEKRKILVEFGTASPTWSGAEAFTLWRETEGTGFVKPGKQEALVS